MSADAGDLQACNKQKKLGTILLRALLFAILLFGIGQIDPFGFSTATNKHSRTLVYQIIAPHTKPEHCELPSEDCRQATIRERITMLMLDDQDLTEFGQPWPTEYGFHAAILQTLKDLEVAAVFIDIGFLDERSEDSSFSELIAVIGDYHDAKIPLMMAGTPGEGGDPNSAGIQQKLADMEKDGKLKVVPVPGGLGEHEGIVYPLWSVEGRRPTAAMALYNAVCKEANCFTATPKQPEMEVTWKISDNRVSLDSYQKRSCLIHSPTWGERVMKMFFAPLPFVDGDLRNPCPYHATAPIRKLFSAEPELATLFKDKVVIYGADLLMAADLVDPPTHPPLPAANLHAMALDNLLDRGEDYHRVKSDGLLNYLSLVCLFILILVEQYMAPIINNPGVALIIRCKKAIEWTVVSLIIVVIFSYIAYEHLNLGVSNWAGLLLLNAGFALIDMRAFINTLLSKIKIL